jgi:uncharacterized protein YbjT (DUF2867 family)
MILVTGATGILGKEVVKQLIPKKTPFRCLVRKSPKTKDLEEMGTPLCYGDVTDQASLKEAMDEVKAVISCHSLGLPKKGTSCWEVDYKANLDLIERLKENGGGKFVYISALGVNIDSAFPLFKAKFAVENTLQISDLDYTILRPSGFFSDFTRTASTIQKYHIFPVMGGGNDPIQGIHEADIATCAVDALQNKKASNKTFSMGGPEALTLKQVAEIYSTVLGFKVRTIPIPVGVQNVFGYVADGLTGYQYSIQGFLEAFSGESLCDNRPLLDTFDIELSHFEDYLREVLG